MRYRSLPLAAAPLLAAVVAGCGLTNPYATQTARTGTARPATTTTATATTTVTDADPIPERGGTISRAARRAQAALGTGAAAPSPQAALQRYARLYSNWTAATVANQQRQLAAISLGSARGQALQAAASYRHDTTLRASHVANSGGVITIAKGQGAATGSWVVVTRETTTGRGDYQGLPAQLHITYAQLTHTPDGWVISSWSPQS
jgi:hypothetical protein